jgi:LacI family transcriptional regulator
MNDAGAIGDTQQRYGRATIGDVAERAGVSIATVSRVVNGRYGVAPGTLERVRAVIDDLGYESSLVARSLRSQRTNVIGVLVTDIEPFSAEVLKGVAGVLRDTDFELVVYSGAQGGDRDHSGWERRYLSRLSGTLTDGTILVTPTLSSIPTDHPIVAVDPHTGKGGFPTVASQNFEGAVMVTEHLLELGHRRIAFIGGRADLESARQREAGFRAAMEAAGVAVDPALVTCGEFRHGATVAAARGLLALDDRPTAIFAANDLSAIDTIEEARAHGLDVPRELSIVGYDNVPDSALCSPPLTTVDQSLQSLGAEAARLLIDLIEHPESATGPAPHIALPGRLLVRASSAPP